MFAKRRKNYRVFVVTALIISICALIIVVLWPAEQDDKEDDINVNAQTSTIENKDENSSKDEMDVSTNYEKDDTTTKNKTYYIVKKYDEVISVFFVTEDGQQVKLEDTEILYDLLPPEDQKNFERGIILEKQEDISSLLQDFEG